MFPSAVMIAASLAFMAAGLRRLSVRGRVRASIRATIPGALLAYQKAAFARLTPLWCHMFSPGAAILKNASMREIYSKTHNGHGEEPAGGGEWWSEDMERGGGRQSQAKIRTK